MHRIVRSKSKPVPLRASGETSPVLAAGKKIAKHCADIASLKKIVRNAEATQRLLRMIDDMPVAVMTVDLETFRINYANETSKTLIRSIEHLLPLKAEDLIGTSIDVFHRHPEAQRQLLSNGNNLPHSARINLGSEVLDLKVTAITSDEGLYLGPMLTWAIVTKEVEAERRITQLAHYDMLTGLANRASFNEHLQDSLSIPGNNLSLLFIDLDGFKLVNDTLGHPAGDNLLRMVAERLRGVCVEANTTIGRLGGDEFAILCHCNDMTAIKRLASCIIDALSMPYRLDNGQQVQVGVSIGIAMAPLHGLNAETLCAHADIALYAAKAAGKGMFWMFSPDLEAGMQHAMRLESGLKNSLQSGEGLFVFYQPIVDAVTQTVSTREALLRWHHPEAGWVSPSEFIPIAERSGLIFQLGAHVLETACRDAAGWEDGARVAVNISPVQLGKGTLLQTVLSALTTSGLAPDRLEIEVTETAIMEGRGSVGDLRQLKAIGVHVALDDFGTGYSTFSALRAFAFDKIKIDGSFVRAAVEHADAAAIVRAICDLGKRLNVVTVAEGVETRAHFDRVLEEGCMEIQGYLFGRPTPPERDLSAIEHLNNQPISTVG